MFKDFINIRKHAIEIFTCLTIERRHVSKLQCGTTFSALG